MTSEQINFITTIRLPILQLSCRLFFFFFFFHHLRLLVPPQPIFGSLRLLAFPKTKIAVERKEIREYGGHTVHKLSQRRLTAHWLDPRANDCSGMHGKVSSDWLPSYIRPLDRFSRYSKWLDTFRTALVYLTPWNTVLLEKLVNKFPTFYGNWKFITPSTHLQRPGISSYYKPDQSSTYPILFLEDSF
jgi:hypothetical protein